MSDKTIYISVSKATYNTSLNWERMPYKAGLTSNNLSKSLVLYLSGIT